MSPLPSNCSAPTWSNTTLESMDEATLKAILAEIFAFIRPVITSTEGLWVASNMWIPAALAFWASLAMRCSTFFPTTIIRSANSSTAITIKGNSVNKGISDSTTSSPSLGFQRGSLRGFPLFIAWETFVLNPFKFLTDKDAISLYLLSISFTHHLRPCAASDISVITGVSKWGRSS